jgi:O-antigen/teichoic acid export membrane protein
MMAKGATNAGKILHNSFWYGLETMLETVVFLGTAIAVANYLGPDNQGHFAYINFFVTTITRTSGTGLAGATRKYMSEFLGLGQPGVARAVYNLAYRYQLLASVVLTVVALALVVLFTDPQYRMMSAILILSIIPGVMSWVPAQANAAFEDVYENTISAFGYILSYTAVILLTLHFHWGLVGIASAQLIGRSVEVVMRTIPLHGRLRRIPLEPIDLDIKLRIRNFCLQAMGIQLLMSVVWDRSELIFLRHFSTWSQIGFYSVSFTLANNLLVFPRTFGGATGLTLMVEAMREPGRVDSIVKNACRFLLLVVFPVHLGAAAIAGKALGVAYDSRYTGAIPVVIIASILAMPRAFQEIAEVLLRTADKQRQILIWFSITAVVNIALDWYLIPRFGAVGAAWGNGLAQTFGIVAIWQQAKRFYRFGFPVWTALRLMIAGLLMAVISYYTGRAVPGLPGLILAVVVGALSYVVLVKVFRGLESSDRQRLAQVGARLPAPLRTAYDAVLGFVTPAMDESRASV